jgi:glycosyltransferase involved in cell wall biosynthesis
VLLATLPSDSCHTAADLAPKLSIITPSLNQGRFIEHTIRSVLDQGYENLEYMIIDGGSRDETVEIVRRYEDRLAWWVSEPDDGQTHALNKGLARVTGDVVAYINSDDYYLPGAFERALSALEASDHMWVAGSAKFTDEYGNVTEVWVPRPPSEAESLIRGRHWWMLAPWSVPQPSTFIRREAIEEVGPFREDMHYAFDCEYFLRLAYAGHLPLLIEDELSVRVVHPAAKSAGDLEPFRRDIRRFPQVLRSWLSWSERVKLMVSQVLVKTRMLSALRHARIAVATALGAAGRILRGSSA